MGASTGIVLFLVALFIFMRTVRRDASGRTLPDHILGKPARA